MEPITTVYSHSDHFDHFFSWKSCLAHAVKELADATQWDCGHNYIWLVRLPAFLGPFVLPVTCYDLNATIQQVTKVQSHSACCDHLFPCKSCLADAANGPCRHNPSRLWAQLHLLSAVASIWGTICPPSTMLRSNSQSKQYILIELIWIAFPPQNHVLTSFCLQVQGPRRRKKVGLRA
jgi:hypothetical protein